MSTIAAIATAAGNGGIGIVRISGDKAIEVADRIYRSVSGNFRLSSAKSHTVHYGFIYDGEILIDEVLVSVFLAPRSFTAENVVEISCHGGYFVTRKILSLAIKNGARIAEPGEFTKRAFLNGRIDLTQAEAVIDMINAKNDFAMINSAGHLRDFVKDKLSGIRERILNETAFIESAIDDPENYSLDENSENLKLTVDNILSEIEHLIANSGNAKLLKNGINTLIIGKPNAGKSSLLNILTGEDRAIVTDIAGTTRDTIEEAVNVDGIILNLIDTAGIRSSDNEIERIGVNKSLSLIDKADLVMYVMDMGDKPDENDERIADALTGKNVIVVLNKSDIAGDGEPDILKFAENISKSRVVISAKTGEGIGLLTGLISEMFMLGEISYDEELYITNERQLDCMRRARESLVMVRDALKNGESEDLITIDLMDAYGALGEISGEQVTDDLADRIFERFCMGK